MSKARDLLNLFEASAVSEPVRKWMSYAFKDMQLSLETIKSQGDRIAVYTKRFNPKKFKRLGTEYTGDETIDPQRAFELIAKEELKSTKPKNITIDWDTLSSHTELVSDGQMQGVVSFSLREM